MERRRIAQLLPDIFQRSLLAKWWQNPETSEPTALGALLAVMEQLPMPADTVLKNLEWYFDPYLAFDEWLPFLATWLDLDRFLIQDENGAWIFPGGTRRLRKLIIEAVSLNQERGTYHGLKRFLEIATGNYGFTITPAATRPYHIIVTYPADLQVNDMSQPRLYHWLTDLVEAEKPAYVTFEIMPEHSKDSNHG